MNFKNNLKQKTNQTQFINIIFNEIINMNEEEDNNILNNLLILNYIYKKKSNESYLSSMNLFELLNIIEKNKNNQQKYI